MSIATDKEGNLYTEGDVMLKPGKTVKVDGVNAITSAEQIATAVSDAIDALLDGAPTALNTLNELAAAVNDDQNFAATVATALAAKAPTASPIFTGSTKITPVAFASLPGSPAPGMLATINDGDGGLALGDVAVGGQGRTQLVFYSQDASAWVIAAK